MQDDSPTPEKQSLLTNLLLKYMTDAKEKRKKVKEVHASSPQGHHAIYTKVKNRGTPQAKRLASKRSRRINRRHA